jgi:signal transduction histidine kinase
MALATVCVTVMAVVSVARALDFGDGVVLAATPASGVALAAGVLLRVPGAVAAGLGFLMAGFLWGLAPATAAMDGVVHGVGALLGATVMRALARRRSERSRTSDWFIFVVGVVIFTAVVAAGYGLAWRLGIAPAIAPTLALVYQPFGLLTSGAMLASLREWPEVRADFLPAFRIVALASVLIVLLLVLLSLELPGPTPSGLTLLVSVPLCLWVAMQRRSLDGATLSFLAAQIVLFVLLAQTGGIAHLDLVTSVVYLNVLVAVCQLVHAVNRDRLIALAEVEAQRSELERRVRERTAKLRAVTERALAADAAKTRFMATVSHEVRTPLSGVIGMASVVLSGELDARTRRNVEIIRTSAYHLLDVINRILDYARRDVPLREEDLEVFDLRAMVQEVIEEATFLPYAEGLAIRSEVAPGVASARRGYRQGLRQVLTNLVGNAAKFTEEGEVVVRVREPSNGVLRIEVSDTGIGIAPSLRERIFEPFEQGEGSATRRHGGTGLGLAISADVVRRLRGRIGVESALGTGSTFWVEVPMPVDAAVAAAESRALG